MMPCIGHHSDINRSWLCRWFMLIKSSTLFTLIRYCIFDSQNFNLYFWTMNVTETNIIEDDRRIIPMKEITKDWLLISISIIIIGKSECRYFSRKKVHVSQRWHDRGQPYLVVKCPPGQQNKNTWLIIIKFACWL